MKNQQPNVIDRINMENALREDSNGKNKGKMQDLLRAELHHFKKQPNNQKTLDYMRAIQASSLVIETFWSMYHDPKRSLDQINHVN